MPLLDEASEAGARLVAGFPTRSQARDVARAGMPSEALLSQ